MTTVNVKKWKIICVVGARPNFMKIAPILSALRESPIDALLVHTGQHYDQNLSASFFDQLNIPAPQKHLNVGSGSHSNQIAEVMKRFDPLLVEEKPDAVLVVGDVNSTLAAAIAATKRNIPVVHVEAGLRSNDRAMPEEINRILTDQIADVLYTTERQAGDNLLREGIPPQRIVFVGNVMVDTLRNNLDRAKPPRETLATAVGAPIDSALPYGILTLHRPSNVDARDTLEQLLQTIVEASERIQIAFPAHPRTLARIEAFGFLPLLSRGQIGLLPPLGYLEMLGLMAGAKLVLTDSGGIQEETTALGVPCLTLRENTERPITISQGTNTLVGTDPHVVQQAIAEVLSHGAKQGRTPEYWDGNAAKRIMADLVNRLAGETQQ